MLARINGGNSGIAEYLEKGIKNGRDFTRDELDSRMVLSGDLELTNGIINSIEDKGQDRYLHITLSFREDMLSSEVLKSVVEDYKELLMSAYKDDEYNFYAEAHLPKIKSIVDNKTGELLTRKPHIHIVIPKTNLLSGNSLNPFGKYTQSEKYLDAMQEKINLKYGLQSPKDYVRQGDDFQAAVISRIKGDFYKEKQGEIKREILYKVHSNEIHTMDKLYDVVSSYGEVKTRNAGKTNEYLSVKIDGDLKFTNLKSPVFSRQYIENRSLPIEKPTAKQIETRLETWQNIASREIKFVANATPKFREKYRDSSINQKQALLTERENSYEQRYREKDVQRSKGWKGNHESSSTKFKTRHLPRYTYGLPSLHERNVVYGIRGKQYNSQQVERLLLDTPSSNLADGRDEEPQRLELRRFGNESTTGRITTANEISQFIRNEIENEKKSSDLNYFAEIKKNLEPKRLLNFLSQTNGIVPSDYEISFAKDGSSRINVGKLNLNVSDFLTKHMNIQWDEAKVILEKCYEEQRQNTSSHARPEIKTHDWKGYTKTYRPVFNSQIKVLRRDLRSSIKELRSDSFSEYQRSKKAIYKELRDPKERKAALSIALVERLKREELIRDYKDRHQNTISAMFGRSETEKFDDYLNQKGEAMSIADKVRNLVQSEENSIVKSDMEISFESNVKRLQDEALYLSENNKKLKMNDLIHSKTPKGTVNYKSRHDGSVVFEDKGDRIVFNRKTLESDKIAIGLEVAMAKYGNELKLTGSDKFKMQVVEVAAEKGLKLLLKPEKYNELLLQKQTELAEELSLSGNENITEKLVDSEQEQAVAKSSEAANQTAIETNESTNDPQISDAPLDASDRLQPQEPHHEPDMEPEFGALAEQQFLEAEQINATAMEPEMEPDFGALAEQQFLEQAQMNSEADDFEEPSERDYAYAELHSEITQELYGRDHGLLSDEQRSVADQETLQIWNGRYPEGYNTTQAVAESNILEDAPNIADYKAEDVMTIEYSYLGEGNKFVMSIDGRAAADVIKERPEVVDALSKNVYLKQFTHDELASGIIDESGKGRALDDVIDMEGRSIVPAEIEKASEQDSQIQSDDMEM